MQGLRGAGLKRPLFIIIVVSWLFAMGGPALPSSIPESTPLAEPTVSDEGQPDPKHGDPEVHADPEVADAGAVEKPLAGKVIALDPGHGGRDRGAVGLNGTEEADNNLAIALKTKQVLEEAGSSVVLTRADDTEPGAHLPGGGNLTVRLSHRVNVAEAAGADVLVSIHNDANLNRAIHGTSTYTWHAWELAEAVQGALVEHLGSRNIGVLKAPFWVIRTASIPAILVEVGFISNPEEEALLASESYQRRAAEGIRDGLIRYFHG